MSLFVRKAELLAFCGTFFTVSIQMRSTWNAVIFIYSAIILYHLYIAVYIAFQKYRNLFFYMLFFCIPYIQEMFRKITTTIL